VCRAGSRMCPTRLKVCNTDGVIFARKQSIPARLGICRANMAHIRHLNLASGFYFQITVLKIFEVIPSSPRARGKVRKVGPKGKREGAKRGPRGKKTPVTAKKIAPCGAGGGHLGISG